MSSRMRKKPLGMLWARGSTPSWRRQPWHHRIIQSTRTLSARTCNSRQHLWACATRPGGTNGSARNARQEGFYRVCSHGYVIGSQRPVQENCERVIRTSTRLMWTSSPRTCTWSSKRNGWVKQDVLPFHASQRRKHGHADDPSLGGDGLYCKVAGPFVASHSAYHC